MTENTLSEDIANQLRRNILRGKLSPGDPIKERDTAAEMGVSRTPLREAVRVLAQEGLVDLRPARSPIVAVASVKQVTDDAEVLLGIEILSSELACDRATQAELDSIEAVVDKMEAAFDETDHLDLFEMDMAFHSAIAKAAHNRPLAEIHSAFLGRLWRMRFLASIKRRNRDRVISHHRKIAAALLARDAQAARACILMHLGDLRRDIVELIEQDQLAAKK